MKKTIAILLVLVIAMAGVWAADTSVTLDLATTVAGVNRIAINTTDDYAFPTLGEDEADPNNIEFAIASAFGGGVHDVGYIHYKTNNANAVSVTMTGTYLENLSNSALFIPYVLTVLDSSGTTANDKSISMVTGIAGTDVSSVILYSASYSATFSDSRKIQISGVQGNADDYPAGTYEAVVTFTLTAN